MRRRGLERVDVVMDVAAGDLRRGVSHDLLGRESVAFRARNVVPPERVGQPVRMRLALRALAWTLSRR